MRRLLPLAIAATMACLPASSSAAAPNGWRATQVAGEVRIEIAGNPAVPLTTAMTIESEALIETAASGSATLVRGEDRVVVAPNSRMRLAAEDASGFTHIIEEFGQLFFQVGKESAPHFRVDTPLLAATVKGTAFTVSVDHKGASVDVSEGLVFVENSTSSDSTYVTSGRSASVSLAEPLTLHLDRSIIPPTGMRLHEPSEASLEPINAAPASQVATARHPPAPHTTTLPDAKSGILFTSPADGGRASSSTRR